MTDLSREPCIADCHYCGEEYPMDALSVTESQFICILCYSYILEMEEGQYPHDQEADDNHYYHQLRAEFRRINRN